MDRVEFLAKGLDINEVQASLISELIKDIPDDKLKDFLVFRMGFIDQYKSKELITKEALFEYQKIKTQHQLKKGVQVFENMASMIKYIETYFKGKELGNGLASYYDYVVIGLDKDLNLINKYKVLENGGFYKLNSEEKTRVYTYLFENQHKIGSVEYVPYYETAQIEHKKEQNNTIESKKVGNLLKNMKGKL